MNLHLNKEIFRDMINTLNTRTGIAIDIIEKIIMFVWFLRNYLKNKTILKHISKVELQHIKFYKMNADLHNLTFKDKWYKI